MKLRALFSELQRAKRPAFIPYLMAGDPTPDVTVAMLAMLRTAGADIVEVGIPYGDPLADGPTIAAAGQRALKRGGGVEQTLEIIAQASASAPPMVIFSYFNPLMQYGFERFARDAKTAGAVGVIVPDVVLEEAHTLQAALAAEDLDMPLLVAPTTSQQRAARICEQATGFVYVVSRLGVTGAGSVPDFTPLHEHIARLREVTEMPLAVGFGVSNVGHVTDVAAYADGIIVGSALIDAYAHGAPEDAVAAVEAFVSPLIAAARG
ncbi:MAG: tryptophan synthase subunit alpha [Vulcanimicrobiaceae bacterium]